MELKTEIPTLLSIESGLATAVAATRRRALGPNALRSHRAQPGLVLARQLRSPLLGLLVAAETAAASAADHSHRNSVRWRRLRQYHTATCKKKSTPVEIHVCIRLRASLFQEVISRR